MVFFKDLILQKTNHPGFDWLTYSYFVLIAFLLLLLSLIIYQINVLNFDDAENYYFVYQVIDPLDLATLDGAHREIGLAYVFLPFKALGVGFEACFKLIYIIFSASLLSITLFSKPQSNNSVLVVLAIFIFVVTNRLYIEGAFNFIRSWMAIHLLAISGFFLLRKLTLFGCVLSLFAFFASLFIHMQTTVIGVALFCVFYFAHKVKRHSMLIVFSIIFYALVYLVMDFFGLKEMVKMLNPSAAENAENASGLGIGMMYQTIIPILLLVGIFAGARPRGGVSVKLFNLSIAIQFGIFSIAMLWIIPVLSRFFILFLVYQLMIFPKDGTVTKLSEIFLYVFVAMLNCLALLFSSLWNAA